MSGEASETVVLPASSSMKRTQAPKDVLENIATRKKGRKSRDPHPKFKALRIWIPEEYSSWKEHKQQSWIMIPDDPNQFFFSYCPPGEQLNLSDNFTEAEQQMILELYRDRPHDGQWGLFSIHVPHRNGNQCKSFIEKTIGVNMKNNQKLPKKKRKRNEVKVKRDLKKVDQKTKANVVKVEETCILDEEPYGVVRAFDEKIECNQIFQPPSSFLRVLAFKYQKSLEPKFKIEVQRLQMHAMNRIRRLVSEFRVYRNIPKNAKLSEAPKKLQNAILKVTREYDTMQGELLEMHKIEFDCFRSRELFLATGTMNEPSWASQLPCLHNPGMNQPLVDDIDTILFEL